MKKVVWLLGIVLPVLFSQNARAISNSEKLKSSLIFDCDYYVDKRNNYDLRNLKSCDAAKNHWLSHGVYEGRRSSPFFHVKDYVAMHSDLKKAYGTNYYKIALHYYNHGKSEGRKTRWALESTVFNASDYKHFNDDLKINGVDMNDAQLKDHWAREGVFDGRRASFTFDVHEYVRMYSDIRVHSAVEDINATDYLVGVNHFARAGFKERRGGTRFLRKPYFNCDEYRQINKDLSNMTCLQASKHWLKSGLREGRVGTSDFSIKEYLNDNPKLKQRFGSQYYIAWHYYIRHGVKSNFYEINEAGGITFNDLENYWVSNLTPRPETAKFTDSRTVIQSKINSIKSNEENEYGVLKFTAGEYQLNCAPNTWCLELNTANKILLEGEIDPFTGEVLTTFVIKNAQSGVFYLEESKDVIIKNINIVYDTVPFIQGTITAINKANRTFELALDADLKSMGADDFTLVEDDKGTATTEDDLNNIMFGFLLDDKQPTRKRKTRSHYSVKEVSEKSFNKFEIELVNDEHMANFSSDATIGNRFVMIERNDKRHAIYVHDSRGGNVEFHNISMDASPGLSVMLQRNEKTDFVFNNLQIKPKKESWFLSTNGDGIHAQSNRGKIILANSYFQGMADDATNFYANEIRVKKLLDTTSEGIKTHISAYQFAVGDTVQFLSEDKFLIETVVKKVNQESGTANDYVIFGEIPNEIKQDNVFCTNSEECTVGDLLKRYITYNVDRSSTNSIVQNNIFAPNRRSGVLAKSDGIAIKDNVFMFTDVNAINLSSDSTEGPLIKSATIEGNKMGVGQVMTKSESIKVVMPFSNNSSFKKVDITNNEISNCTIECIKFEKRHSDCVSNNLFTFNNGYSRLDWNEPDESRLVVKGTTCVDENRFYDDRPQIYDTH
ncbi:hypothetical protein [Aliikangiella coralliicola]|uniref:Right-handed parallel beta-helix repeat-containing protein n=1 Tax=Aliikangiella coralliicola TaxID=2592383 RepID=A0A545UH97_9GAMM|nr:hypothetical protein [Aliikangiella coralliicola]TQV88846.1 hypothetical protein FLL46_04750 [Aliikangiella coralliicola]